MKVKSNVKAGGIHINHSQSVKGLRVKSKVKAGKASDPTGQSGTNHNQTVSKGLRVKSSVKAGWKGPSYNHNQAVKGLRVKASVRAGKAADPTGNSGTNHNQTVARRAR